MKKKHISLSKRIKNLVGEIGYFLIISTNKFPKIESEEKTIEKIINDRCSIARLGDGEIRLLGNADLIFQEFDQKLSDRLNEIIKSNDDEILIALPNVFSYKDLKNVTRDEQLFWKKDIILGYKNYKKLVKDKLYYNANISRPYIRYVDKKNAKNIFEQLKKIWNQRDIVIIEGMETRLGIGNDLFDNTKSISRILCPVRNAFSKYDEILENALKISKDKLVIISLGPTATVLAYDLAKNGYQALDLGHVDIEYEWMKMGAIEKVKVKGKYTNEVDGGNQVENLIDQDYEKEIIIKIDNK
jgi:glycosyltransferase family protein